MPGGKDDVGFRPPRQGKDHVIGSREFIFQLVQVLAGDRPGLARNYGNTSVTIGREGCTLSFPTDRFMSHEHARIVPDGSGLALEDAGSKNGSYYRVKDEANLLDGDTLFIGKQLVRIEL